MIHIFFEFYSSYNLIYFKIFNPIEMAFSHCQTSFLSSVIMTEKQAFENEQ